MPRTALLRTADQTVTNVVVDGDADWAVPDGHIARELTDTEAHVGPGWRWLNNAWAEPDPNTPKPPEQVAADNRATLLQQAANAMQGNRDFLALTSPTNAQTLAQVKALTRQNQALIRLAANLLEGTA